MSNPTQPISVIMLGASGAVGSVVVRSLLGNNHIAKISLLVRKNIDAVVDAKCKQHIIDIHNGNTYASFISGHQCAICTLGVGEPSKVSKEEFVKIDKIAVLAFAALCKQNGVTHFQLLASVNQNASSSNHYLRIKGELVVALQALQFDALSIFEPSMILTPKNRYGFGQAVMLFIWPKIHFLFQGAWHKYRGIPIGVLGNAIANNTMLHKPGVAYLQWDDFYNLQ